MYRANAMQQLKRRGTFRRGWYGCVCVKAWTGFRVALYVNSFSSDKIHVRVISALPCRVSFLRNARANKLKRWKSQVPLNLSSLSVPSQAVVSVFYLPALCTTRV